MYASVQIDCYDLVVITTHGSTLGYYIIHTRICTLGIAYCPILYTEWFLMEKLHNMIFTLDIGRDSW